jgi:alpha-ketoglutarate-dependent taurine dioxygenase
MHKWPMKIWFYCVTPAETGGETPIVDCRRVYHALPREIRDQFEQRRLLYVRNYINGLDVSWQSFFKTEDRAAVEAFCRNARIEFDWKKEDELATRRLCPAVLTHPATREKVFFNQIQLHHLSCLDASMREHMRTLFREEEFPRNVYFGDGGLIEDSIVAEIRELYRENSVNFPWQKGDILMLDNMLVAHGRNPYTGRRKIVVAMGGMTGCEAFEL